MNARGLGVVGWVLILGGIAGVAFVGLRLSGPAFHRSRVRAAVEEILGKEFAASDETIREMIVRAGRDVGVTIRPEAIAIARAGRTIAASMVWDEDVDLVAARLNRECVVTAEREVSWARGVVDAAQRKVDQAARDQRERFSNAPE